MISGLIVAMHHNSNRRDDCLSGSLPDRRS